MKNLFVPPYKGKGSDWVLVLEKWNKYKKYKELK